MHFGSEEMKEKLILALNNPDMYDPVMNELEKVVKAYTIGKLEEGFDENVVFKGSRELTTSLIQRSEYNTVADDVFSSVVISLDRFIKNVIENNYTEAQRQAWLRRVVYNVIAKALNKKARQRRVVDALSSRISMQLIDNGQSVGQSVQFECTVRSFIEVACRAPSKPEKILAYIYNVIIFRELYARVHNSTAQPTCDYMNGKTLFKLKNLMVSAIMRLYHIRLGKRELLPLEKILGDTVPTEKGKEICSLDPKLVTDWSNRMKTYIFKHKSEIYGEEGGFSAGK